MTDFCNCIAKYVNENAAINLISICVHAFKHPNNHSAPEAKILPIKNSGHIFLNKNKMYYLLLEN
jgi:hypothetical protein